MRQTLFVVLVLFLSALPASAANKEHQQLMADLRMLQEQAQMLQNALGTMTEVLKAVNTRLDQQTESTRKAFADQKLVIDNLTNDVRVIRERLDDNNVRIGSLTQEVDALRQSLQQSAVRPTTSPEPDPAAAGGTTAGGPPPPPPTGGSGSSSSPMVANSPQKTWDAAYADYTSGNYDLAIIGWESYIKSFPRSDMADDAQVYICNSYLSMKKDDLAVQACDAAIRAYPNGNAIPEAYYKKGLALSNRRDLSNARTTWEELVQKYPGNVAAQMAEQALARLRRPD